MKTIISGGRDYYFTDSDRQYLDDLHARHPITEVVSGGSHGADWEGEVWANAKGIPVNVFAGDWSKGKAAGPIRNGQMAEYADMLVAFPGDKGTANMVKQAKERGLIVWEV